MAAEHPKNRWSFQLSSKSNKVRKIDSELLAAAFNNPPDVTLEEIVQQFNCWSQSIHKSVDTSMWWSLSWNNIVANPPFSAFIKLGLSYPILISKKLHPPSHPPPEQRNPFPIWGKL